MLTKSYKGSKNLMDYYFPNIKKSKAWNMFDVLMTDIPQKFNSF